MNDLASGIAAPKPPIKSKEMQAIGKPEKKGKQSWKPASLLDVINKEDGYRYRWVNKDPQNLFNKKHEGWETVSGLTFDRSKQPEDVKRMTDGANMGSTLEKHDSVLMRLPEELAVERDDYYNNESARRIAGITSHVKKEAKKHGTETHGEITISSRHGTEIVE